MDKENEEVETQETSTLANEFNSESFIGDSDELNSNTDVQENDEAQTEEVSSEVEETIEQPSQEEESDWGDYNVGETTTTEDNDSDVSLESGEETEAVSESWQNIAEAIGIETDDYDTFIDTLKNQQDLAAKGATNEKILGLNNLISLDDETLMREELTARGFSKHEVEDELDIMIENNTIRSEARRVRKDLEGVVDTEKQQMSTQSTQPDAKQQEEVEAAATELRDYMSKTTEMFGGRINTTQRDKHSEYITTGEFFDEISESAETMAQAAWLWKYKDHIISGQKSAGVEKGKASILNKMSNPEPIRRTSIPDPETGEFNPNRFMDSGNM